MDGTRVIVEEVPLTEAQRRGAPAMVVGGSGADAAAAGPSGDPQSLPPLDPSALRESAHALLDEMTKHPSWTAEQRRRYALREHERLAKTYPKLMEMCTGVRSFTEAANVRNMLEMMLSHMQRVEQGEETLEGATDAVGRSLGKRYLPADLQRKQQRDMQRREAQ